MPLSTSFAVLQPKCGVFPSSRKVLYTLYAVSRSGAEYDNCGLHLKADHIFALERRVSVYNEC